MSLRNHHPSSSLDPPMLDSISLDHALFLSLSLSGVDVKEKALLDEEGGGSPRTN